MHDCTVGSPPSGRGDARRKWLLRVSIGAALLVAVVGSRPLIARLWAPTPAPTLYVAPTGTDRTSSGSAVSPFHTIEYAVSRAVTGSTVMVAQGVYAPFAIATPGLAVVGESRSGVVVRGTTAVAGVVDLVAPGGRVSNLTVTGCEPNPRPDGSFEFAGSASVLVRDTAINSVVSNVTVASGHGINSFGLPFGCYGVYVAEGSGVTVSGNDISGQGDGVFLYRGGQDVNITSNDIHDNAYEIRNTPMSNDDFGGTGVDLFETAGVPGVLVSGNVIYNNFAPSHDYTIDGGAFDMFEAAEAVISNNTIYNNALVMETGAGASTATCANDVFTGNTVSGRTVSSTIPHSTGMILRCATNMQITKNTFLKLDLYTFDIEQGGNWTGQLRNLTITGNQITQGQDKVYALLVDPKSVGMTINNNSYSYTGWLGVDWTNHGWPTLSGWQSATGMDAASASR